VVSVREGVAVLEVLDRVTLAAVAARTPVLQDGPCTALSTYPLWAASVALDGVGTVTLLDATRNLHMPLPVARLMVLPPVPLKSATIWGCLAA
jgi:hypothetical protein